MPLLVSGLLLVWVAPAAWVLIAFLLEVARRRRHDAEARGAWVPLERRRHGDRPPVGPFAREVVLADPVHGTLTNDGVECQALRASDGSLYTLAGMPDRFEPGDRVRVEGTIAEVSTCMQGTTIRVKDMTMLERREDRQGTTLKVKHIE